METKKLAVALVRILNAAAEDIEKLISEDDENDEGNERGSRSRGKDKDAEERGSRRRNDKPVDDPTEDDIVDAVRGAQKTLDSKEVKAIMKKHGKKERASEVEPELRQAVIDALEKAVAEAE